MDHSNVDVIELTRKLGRDPTVTEAIPIIMWELGDLAKSDTYAQWHPELASAYFAEARKALGDLFFQLTVVARLLGTTPEASFSLGLGSVKDRIKEKEMGMGRFRYYKGDKKSG